MLQNVTDNVTSLSDRQSMALPYLVLSQTLTEAARLADISRTTLYRWLEDDDFRREFECLRDEAVELAHAELKGLFLKAVLVLGAAMEDSNPFIRLRAAQTAINTHIKANELKEIEKRLTLLDDALPLWSRRNIRW